jgi:hypothetical protein
VILDAPGYVARLNGRLAPRMIVVQLRWFTEDGERVNAPVALPVVDGDVVGRVALIEWGGGGHTWPPDSQPGAAIRDLDARLIVEYLPGLRGGLGETGITLEPITVKSYGAMRTENPDLPPLATEAALLAWLRSGSMLP